jgi:hypothetical protein
MNQKTLIIIGVLAGIIGAITGTKLLNQGGQDTKTPHSKLETRATLAGIMKSLRQREEAGYRGGVTGCPPRVEMTLALFQWHRRKSPPCGNIAVPPPPGCSCGSGLLPFYFPRMSYALYHAARDA